MKSTLLFFLLTIGYSWTLWLVAPQVSDGQTDVKNLLVRLGLYGPSLMAMAIAWFSSSASERPRSERRLLWRGALFLITFGLTLFLLTWQKSLQPRPQLSTLSFTTDAILAAVAGLVISARFADRTAVRQLLKPLFHWRVGPTWYLFALFAFPLISCTTIIFVQGGGRSFSQFVLNAFGEPTWLELFLLIILSALVGGPLGEEIGWRGFALPRLKERYSDTVSSLIIGCVWSFWHIPLYWINVYAGGWVDITARFLWTIPLSFLFTWLFNHTAGSLLLAVLLHTSFNVSPFSLNPLNIVILWALARMVQVSDQMNRPPFDEEPPIDLDASPSDPLE